MKWKKRGESVSGGGPLWSKGAIIHHVVAKSAGLRFRRWRKLRPLPCSSFPHKAGFAGAPGRCFAFCKAIGVYKIKQGLTSLRRFHGYPSLETEGRLKCQTRIAR